MEVWKYVYFLLMISGGFILASCIFMIVLSVKIDKAEDIYYNEIWISSKILTVNQIIKKK